MSSLLQTILSNAGLPDHPYVAKAKSIPAGIQNLSSFSHLSRLWKDSLVITAYLSAFSALILSVQFAWHSAYIRRRTTQTKPSLEHSDAILTPTSHPTTPELPQTHHLLSRSSVKSSGFDVSAFRWLQLASCLGLVALSVLSCVSKSSDDSSVTSIGLTPLGPNMTLGNPPWLEVIQVISYVSDSLGLRAKGKN